MSNLVVNIVHDVLAPIGAGASAGTELAQNVDPVYILNWYFNSLRPRQMAAISQTTFSSAFSWMKMFHFWIKFQWSLFLKV